MKLGAAAAILASSFVALAARADTKQTATPAASKPAPPPTTTPKDAPKPADPKPKVTPKAEAKPAAAADTPATSEDTFGHHGQGNWRGEFLTGYRMLFRYDKSPRCAIVDYTKSPSDQQKFCGFAASPGIGMALGFSVVDSFEPFVFGRFGLSDEIARTNQGKFVQVGVGARLYTMSDSRFKIFFSPSLGLDLTNGPAVPIGSGQAGADDVYAKVTTDSFRTDILAHLDIGPQYDISRMIGVYLSGGITFQMLRYLGATADLALGVQVRAP
jgi:hypothetical protein